LLDRAPKSDYVERMSTMISEVYDAFVAAGAPEEKARKAAEAVASYDQRFVGIEKELMSLRADVTSIRMELSLHRWMFGVVIALQVAILARLFLT
jgi:hypothetical protein